MHRCVLHSQGPSLARLRLQHKKQTAIQVPAIHAVGHRQQLMASAGHKGRIAGQLSAHMDQRCCHQGRQAVDHHVRTTDAVARA
jgi:hypothetical protein